MLDSSTQLLKSARSLILNPKDPPTWSVLAGHSRTVSDSIKSLITAIRFVLSPLLSLFNTCCVSTNKCVGNGIFFKKALWSVAPLYWIIITFDCIKILDLPHSWGMSAVPKITIKTRVTMKCRLNPWTLIPLSLMTRCEKGSLIKNSNIVLKPVCCSMCTDSMGDNRTHFVLL